MLWVQAKCLSMFKQTMLQEEPEKLHRYAANRQANKDIVLGIQGYSELYLR